MVLPYTEHIDYILFFTFVGLF